MPEVRYYGLGPAAPSKKGKEKSPTETPKKEAARRGPKLPEEPIQTTLNLPSIPSQSTDSGYIINLLEEISAAVDRLDEKVTMLLSETNTKPASPEKEEDHD